MPDAIVCIDCAYHERFAVVPQWVSTTPHPGRPTGGLQSQQRRLRQGMPHDAVAALSEGRMDASPLYREANSDDVFVCDWCERDIQDVRGGVIIVAEWYVDDDDDDDVPAGPVVVLPISHAACAQCEDCEAQLDFGTDPCPHCGGSVRQVEAWTSGTEPPFEPEPEPVSLARARLASEAILDALREAPRQGPQAAALLTDAMREARALYGITSPNVNIAPNVAWHVTPARHYRVATNTTIDDDITF